MYSDVFLNHESFYNRIILLNEEEQKNPGLAFKAFCEDFDLATVRRFLAILKKTIAVSENTDLLGSVDCSNAIFFLEEVERLAEAAFAMRNKNSGSKSTIKKTGDKETA